MNAPRSRAPFGRQRHGSHARGLHDVDEWEPWFAWRPVRLYGEIRFAWLRPVSRRFVLAGPKHLHTEYTDLPAEFPRGFGLKKR
jgi:hypothetical protein